MVRLGCAGMEGKWKMSNEVTDISLILYIRYSEGSEEIQVKF